MESVVTVPVIRMRDATEVYSLHETDLAQQTGRIIRLRDGMGDSDEPVDHPHLAREIPARMEQVAAAA